MGNLFIFRLITICFCFIYFVGPANAEQASDKVWILKQILQNGEKRTVCVSKNGIKFVQNEYVLFTKAPDWKITLLNKKLRNYYKTSLVGINGVSWIDKVPGSVAKDKSSNLTVVGLPASVFESTRESKDKVTVKATRGLPVSGEKLELVQNLYGIENIDGLPLEVSLVDDKNVSHSILVTDWCMSKDLPQSFYNIPRGYMAAKTMSEVQVPKSKSKKRVRKYRPFQDKSKASK